MSLLQEATLERLWSKYESRFGAPPPIGSAGFDEAISLIREKLAEAPDTDYAVPNFMHETAKPPHAGARQHA